MPLGPEDCAATYKVLILGDSSVGKTAILRSLLGKDFQQRILPTIATDFVRKKFEVDGALVELQIWDTAGQERFRSVTRWQYHDVKGVAMVYDVTDINTFSHLSYWIKSVNQEISHFHNKYETIPIVLLGNKIDLEDTRQVKLKDGIKLANKELIFEFFETSARTGQNIFNAFHKLAYHVTEICDPNLMKSFHPHMIREPVPQPEAPCIPAQRKPRWFRHRKAKRKCEKNKIVTDSAIKLKPQPIGLCCGCFRRRRRSGNHHGSSKEDPGLELSTKWIDSEPKFGGTEKQSSVKCGNSSV